MPVLAVVTAMGLLVAGCGKSSKSSSTTTAGSGSSATTAADTGSATTAAADSAGLKAVTVTLHGGGSSLQDTFEQKAAGDFGAAVKAAGGTGTVVYTKSASKDGRKHLADKTLDFAGSDSTISTDKSLFGTRTILYFPIAAGPIAVTFNLGSGVTKLNLDGDTIAKIFQAQITTWNDNAITALNPGVTLPATKISVVHRSDGSGTTNNFTKFLAASAPTSWKLGSGDTVNWPSSTQGAEKNSGVVSVVSSTMGSIAYGDLADVAKANLNVAAVKNKAGKFLTPTPDGSSAALAGTTIKPDLTFSPIYASGDAAYPITAPTWILVDAKQSDQAKADALKAYLTFILDTEQSQAKSLLYAPIPADLAAKAVAQLSQITVG